MAYKMDYQKTIFLQHYFILHCLLNAFTGPKKKRQWSFYTKDHCLFYLIAETEVVLQINLDTGVHLYTVVFHLHGAL